jgi:hypothetical protein
MTGRIHSISLHTIGAVVGVAHGVRGPDLRKDIYIAWLNQKTALGDFSSRIHFRSKVESTELFDHPPAGASRTKGEI